MGIYAQQTISTKSIMGFGALPMLATLAYPNHLRSPFALSLCSITNSQLSLDAFQAPHLHIRVNAHPHLRSELAFCSFCYAQSRRVGFRSMPGVHPHRFVPYHNHAYISQRILMINKVVKKTCTKLMHYKFDKAYSFIKLSRSIVFIKLYRHMVPTGKSSNVLHTQGTFHQIFRNIVSIKFSEI